MEEHSRNLQGTSGLVLNDNWVGYAVVKNFLRFPLPYLEKVLGELRSSEGVPSENAYNNHYSQMKPYSQATE